MQQDRLVKNAMAYPQVLNYFLTHSYMRTIPSHLSYFISSFLARFVPATDHSKTTPSIKSSKFLAFI